MLQEPTGKGVVAVSAALQARVMTSSSNGFGGRSYGWINRALFESRDTLAHINPFGGEERFWLGPEGGQYSIFFKEGTSFNLDDWQTPRLIDLDIFDLVNKSSNTAVFQKEASITNYSGFTFDLEIERIIAVLPTAVAFQSLNLKQNNAVNLVAYKTTNTLTNRGKMDWKKETGLLSIWLLGMFNPSPTTTVVIPFLAGSEVDLGVPVNDDYFGKVPAERLIVEDKVLYFSGDGKYRSKIGLSPNRAKDILGSYDAESKTLTIVKYNKPKDISGYVNSLWEIQDEPYKGDAVNSYNDGPPTPGKKPLGPFYELETSSPALALKAGESGTHIQQTYHFEGAETGLDGIARELLGVGLRDIQSALVKEE